MSDEKIKNNEELDLDDLDSVSGGKVGKRKYGPKGHIGPKLAKEQRNQFLQIDGGQTPSCDSGLDE